MKKPFLFLLLILTFSASSIASDKVEDLYRAALYGSLATWGYVQGANCHDRNNRVYINFISIYLTISATVHLIKAVVE